MRFQYTLNQYRTLLATASAEEHLRSVEHDLAVARQHLFAIPPLLRGAEYKRALLINVIDELETFRRNLHDEVVNSYKII